jgi:hypothetical protein
MLCSVAELFHTVRVVLGLWLKGIGPNNVAKGQVLILVGVDGMYS